jgi:hypothetical protein
MSLTVNINQAKDIITECIKAQLVPMLAGSPAVGKSSIGQQIAKEYNLKVIDLRLGQCDPTDLLGFPAIDHSRDRARYVPMETFPIEGEDLPNENGHQYDGWLLFLDEFNSADRGVQKAAYKLVLDRMVGQHNLHKQVAIMCAGNLETDGAIVEEMSTALQSRMVHLELKEDAKIWMDWATSNGIDHRITSYINFKPGNLYSFKPDHQDKTYASPRTWEFASRLLSNMGSDHPLLKQTLAGTLSEGVAREFIAFTKIYKDLPSINDIQANPEKIKISDEPSILYALSGSISHNATETNIDKLMIFVKRLPIEFQVVCLREIVRRKRDLLASSAVREWITQNATELF